MEYLIVNVENVIMRSLKRMSKGMSKRKMKVRTLASTQIFINLHLIRDLEKLTKEILKLSKFPKKQKIYPRERMYLIKENPC